MQDQFDIRILQSILSLCDALEFLISLFPQFPAVVLLSLCRTGVPMAQSVPVKDLGMPIYGAMWLRYQVDHGLSKCVWSMSETVFVFYFVLTALSGT